MMRFILVAILLAGCSASPEPTAEPPLTLDQEVNQYVSVYGGSASQFRIILTAACPELANLMTGAMGRMETEVENSPEWREALGYASAVNSRQLDLDC
jgi:hypothetical protein